MQDLQTSDALLHCTHVDGRSRRIASSLKLAMAATVAEAKSTTERSQNTCRSRSNCDNTAKHQPEKSVFSFTIQWSFVLSGSRKRCEEIVAPLPDP